MAIIALLAAIAIPNLLRARLNTNESVTIKALKSILTAAISYSSVNNGGYPPALAALTGAVPPYIDATFAAVPAVRNGYQFAYAPNGNPDVQGNFPEGFFVTAAPTARGTTGSRDFYLDDSGVLCASPVDLAGATVVYSSGSCTAPDLPVQ